jgi:hypothetical protein
MISILHLLWIVPLTGCISVAVMALCVVASQGDEEEDAHGN